MLTQGAAGGGPLWCTEYLAESPSTASPYAAEDWNSNSPPAHYSWTFSNSASAALECTSSQHYHRKSSRKQPFSVLPTNNSFDSFFGPSSHNIAEELYSQKRRHIEDRLNGIQRSYVPVDLDKTVHWDNRALEALLEAERQDFCRFADARQMLKVQNDLNYASYRSETARWLSEVCMEENCDFGIFPLSVAYLNRVVSTQRIPAQNLQALASACLFIASKMKAPQPISAKRLSNYSDGYVSAESIMNWEIVVVNLLRWNLSLSTAFEFFDQLLVRAPALETLRDSFCTVLFSMQMDERLSFLLPSQQAVLAVRYLTITSAKWEHYRSLIAVYFKTDCYELEQFLGLLDPKCGGAR